MDSMLGKTLSHFRILSRLGEGGMGVVYKAEDTKLGRLVALKVLPPERVGDEERRLRFLREARTAASINHPNIAAVYEIDEAGGVIFIAMELVDGETLRSVLESGVPPLKKSLGMAVEMAEALGSAHQAKIVHRDLKPENVMVRPDGHVKILDFGLAKLREDTSGSPESTRMETLSAEMTREGKILGTAAYMSPEQARAQALDFRSDLFSFGIVLYEMATGRSPFHGPSVTDTLSSIVRDQPPAMAQVAPGVPDELVRIVGKCLEKDPDERYQHTDDLAMDLRKLRRLTDSQTLSRVSDTAIPAASRPWRRRAALLLLAVAVVVAVAVGLTQLLRTGGPSGGGRQAGNALAVLTFENLQDGEDVQRLGQILQELIITDLSELDSLTVFSSQRLFDIQKQIGGADGGRRIDRTVATQVASKAGATTMLTGSLSRLGNNWILTGQLVDVRSGRVIQSERIDGADLYKMVDDLTGKIREDLQLSQEELSGVDRAVGDRTTSSLEAYQAYLEGTDLLARWRFKEAAAAFQRAVDIDPKFGQARFKHAIATWWALGGLISDTDEASPSELLRDLLDGDYKLSAKDRLLAGGMLAVVEDRHEDAQRELSRLVQDHPDEKEAWYGLGEAYYHQPGGDRQAGYDAFEKALELDPAFQLAYRHLREMYREQKRYRDGIEKLRGLLEHDPDDPGYYEEWVRLLLLDGDAAGAEAVLETALERIVEPAPRREFLLGASTAYRDQDDDTRRRQLLEEALAVATDERTDTVLAELGWHYQNIRDLRQAESYFLQSLELNPRGTGALSGLFNWVYERERRFSDGILRARALIQKDPDHLPFYYQWISMAVHKGDEEEAERAVQAALEHASTPGARKRLWIEVADAYGDVENRTRAAEVLRQALETAPGDNEWQVFLRLGANALGLHRYEEAAEWYAKAAERSDLAEDRTFTGLFEANLQLGRYDAALEVATRHQDTHVREPWVRTQVITAHLAAGQESLAQEALTESLAAFDLPGQKRTLLSNTANAYLAVGDVTRAEKLARQAIDLDPDLRDAWLRSLLARVLIRQERHDEAEAVLRQGLDVAPRALSLHSTFAFLDLVRGEPVAAERRVRDLLADGPAEESLFRRLAQSLAEQGRYGDGAQDARRALAMNPNRRNHVTLAWILVAGELDLDQGMELARAALEQPRSWWAYDRYPFVPSPEHTLGLAHLKQGRQREAIQWLEKAASLRPDRVLIQEHLAEARR